MKRLKFIAVTMSVIILCLSLSAETYAQENEKKNNVWMLFGYGYSIPSKNDDKGLYGPVSLTIGGDIWRFIGLEVALGTRWNWDEKQVNIENSQIVTYNTALWSFDIKPYLMLQPKFGIDLISIRPYVGIGPTFSFTGYNTTFDVLGKSSSKNNNTFNVGFSTKAGVRLQALKFLFIGVGAEYIYNEPTVNDSKYDLSGFNVNGEIGIIW